MRQAVILVNMLLEQEQAIAVDLDGTLAKHVPGKFDKNKIGEPVPAMLKKVKHAIAKGRRVVIFTARATEPDNIPPIKKWLKDNGLPALDISAEKSKDFVEFWDDRAKRVRFNKGTFW